MSQLLQVDLWDPRFRGYLRLASAEWPWTPALLLSLGARMSTEVLVLVHRGEVLAGALLTPRPANFFGQRSRRRLARRLCALGMANLSYFAVRKDRRAQGHGRAFLELLAQQRSFWLACDPSLHGFYKTCGLQASPEDPGFFLGGSAAEE